MNAPAEAFRCQALAKEIVAELRAKYDLKAAEPSNRPLTRRASCVDRILKEREAGRWVVAKALPVTIKSPFAD
jgi:hypothetical protein